MCHYWIIWKNKEVPSLIWSSCLITRTIVGDVYTTELKVSFFPYFSFQRGLPLVDSALRIGTLKGYRPLLKNVKNYRGSPAYICRHAALIMWIIIIDGYSKIRDQPEWFCNVYIYIMYYSWGQHGAHLGPVGPRWAPCWPHEPYIYMAANHVDCLKVDCTSSVEETEIANDQKYRAKCQIKDLTQWGRWLFGIVFL